MSKVIGILLKLKDRLFIQDIKIILENKGYTVQVYEKATDLNAANSKRELDLVIMKKSFQTPILTTPCIIITTDTRDELNFLKSQIRGLAIPFSRDEVLLQLIAELIETFPVLRQPE